MLKNFLKRIDEISNSCSMAELLLIFISSGITLFILYRKFGNWGKANYDSILQEILYRILVIVSLPISIIVVIFTFGFIVFGIHAILLKLFKGK